MTNHNDDGSVQKCGHCHFWKSFSSHKGECKRYPPRRTNNDTSSSFPETYIMEWCGEYKKDDSKK